MSTMKITIGNVVARAELQENEAPVICARMKAAMPIEGMLTSAKIVDNEMTFSVPVGGEWKPVSLRKGKLDNKIDIYFIGNSEYFDRDGVYGDKNGNYHDNLERFTFFSRAVLEGLKQISWKPDVIHCHDWQAGLVPAYVRIIYRDDSFFENSVSFPPT